MAPSTRYARGRVPTASHTSAAVDTPRLEANCLQPIERDIVLAEAMLTHNPAGSIRLLQPYRAAQPDDATLLVLTSRALAQQDNIEEALALAERAHKLAPENPDAIINLGDLLVYGCVLASAPECPQKWQRALPLFRRALQLDRSRIDAVFGLGLSNLYLGKAGDAVNYLRVVYSKVPWAIHVNFYLGESLRIIGDSRARTYLTNARNWAQNDIWSKLASAALAKLDNN